MRPLTRNERLLAVAFGVILFVILNLVAMRWIGDQLRLTRTSITQLEAEAQQLRVLLTERSYWLSRQDWLAQNPPDSFDPRTTPQAFVSEVQSGIQAAGLKILLQQPQEAVPSGALMVPSIDLTVDGRLEAIVRWLHAVQQPGKFTFIPSFTLRQGEGGKTHQLQLRLSKVYRVGGAPPASIR